MLVSLAILFEIIFSYFFPPLVILNTIELRWYIFLMLVIILYRKKQIFDITLYIYIFFYAIIFNQSIIFVLIQVVLTLLLVKLISNPFIESIFENFKLLMFGAFLSEVYYFIVMLLKKTPVLNILLWRSLPTIVLSVVLALFISVLYQLKLDNDYDKDVKKTFKNKKYSINYLKK